MLGHLPVLSHLQTLSTRSFLVAVIVMCVQWRISALAHVNNFIVGPFFVNFQLMSSPHSVLTGILPSILFTSSRPHPLPCPPEEFWRPKDIGMTKPCICSFGHTLEAWKWVACFSVGRPDLLSHKIGKSYNLITEPPVKILEKMSHLLKNTPNPFFCVTHFYL